MVRHLTTKSKADKLSPHSALSGTEGEPAQTAYLLFRNLGVSWCCSLNDNGPHMMLASEKLSVNVQEHTMTS